MAERDRARRGRGKRWRRRDKLWPRLAGAALVAAVTAGCGGGAQETTQPAAALAPLPRDVPLDSTLALLEAELGAALGGAGDENFEAALLRAEAISDRLLESRMPFEWLASGYSVEARLRQIQSLSDRVAAQLRVRGPRERLLSDASDLRRAIVQLRAELAQGGGPAPPPLDQLLERTDTAPGPPAQM